jgi:catechol 2,3-dioxygenase-like lactoylglutathione lyase family enzyme
MLANCTVVPSLATKRPDYSRAFYGKVLGLRLAADTPFALVFDAGGTILRISKVMELKPAPYTVLGGTVPELRAIMRELAKMGIQFERYEGWPQNETGVWTSPDGDTVAWFKDPDGNTLSLTQYHSV